MDRFLQRFAKMVNGVLCGWDRISIRGSIRPLYRPKTMKAFLTFQGVLLKDFAKWAQTTTDQIREGCRELAESLGIEASYLRKPSVDKEELARKIAKKHGINVGPICMFSVVEPSYSPTVVGSRGRKLDIEMRNRKCIWVYLYCIDPTLGFGHLRLQTWAPFTIQGCFNGRHRLERSLLDHGVEYVRHDNCFRWVADVEQAQQLLDAQQQTDWPGVLNALVDRYFPVMRQVLKHPSLSYYWSAEQSEWATDVMFRDTATLDRLFPILARYALTISDSVSVMRYLGRLGPKAALPSGVSSDIRSDRRRRYEGICVKHYVRGNSVKAYNKAGNVLRVETTINTNRDFKVLRHPNDDSSRPASWQLMRKGFADMQRRAQISQSSNNRYLDALAACPTGQTFGEAVERLCRRFKRNGRCFRALNPYSKTDFRLLEFLAQAQWTLNGLRNRDLAAWLCPQFDELSPSDRRKLTSRVSRLLRLLRAHGLIAKVPHTHRYQVTSKGRDIAALLTAASAVESKKLMELTA